jgi:hypothetical protein
LPFYVAAISTLIIIIVIMSAMIVVIIMNIVILGIEISSGQEFLTAFPLTLTMNQYMIRK